MPEVSIVTPCYNSLDVIQDAIISVRNQTFKDYEHIIVDDCSTDGSYDFLISLSLEDPKVRVLRLKVNSGAGVARNEAIRVAEGRYIAFLDSDDIWLPSKLEKQLFFMKNNKITLSYTSYEKIYESGARTGVVVSPPLKLSYAEMLKSNQIGCLTAIYDAGELGKVFMPLIRKRQDYGLWLKILKLTPCAMGLAEPLALYRNRERSISSNKFGLLKYNWILYRQFEKLSFLESLYYLLCDIKSKLFK
ncbi:glycosyltransferase family 2 protein [Vreelandella janggokensis]|uniref:glycosyltransferase family 2 protein n=1 Tax=Vreelandella janggokensis TaxID=370767 RepID=UPI00285C3905|nr:glycosyltransferase family 2 protein [Halomonas janggokensis]MDR5886709.1 glycosyltransferase family 2 protein [Halomonas janggokensis]